MIQASGGSSLPRIHDGSDLGEISVLTDRGDRSKESGVIHEICLIGDSTEPQIFGSQHTSFQDVTAPLDGLSMCWLESFGVAFCHVSPGLTFIRFYSCSFC